MDDGHELIKAGADALTKPLTDLIGKLAGPLAEEIGLTLGDAARVFRFRRAVGLLRKVKKITAEAGYEASEVRPKLLLPILEHASIEDDEGLHDRWAALLANACNPEKAAAIRPSFPDILAQLSSKEVTLLDCAQRHVETNLTKHCPTYPKVASNAYLVDVPQ